MSHHESGQGSGDNNTFSIQDFIDGMIDLISDVYQNMLAYADMVSGEEATIPVTPHLGTQDLDNNTIPDWVSKDGLAIPGTDSFHLMPFGSNFEGSDFYGIGLNYTLDDNVTFGINWFSVGAGGAGPYGEQGGNFFQSPGDWTDGGRGGNIWQEGSSGYEGRGDTFSLTVGVSF